MDRQKRYQYLLICLIIIGLMSSISGCVDSKKELVADTEHMAVDDSTEDSMEKVTEDTTETTSEVSSETESTDDVTVEATKDGIFYWSSEDYFYLLEGKWKAVEYAGTVGDSHDNSTEEDYWEEIQEYTNKITEENLGSEYNITRDNLEYFGPFLDLTIVMDSDTLYFSAAGFRPGVGENIPLTPPYIGLSARLADKGEYYRFIIDAEGTVLIEIDYCFFRLERIEECE